MSTDFDKNKQQKKKIFIPSLFSLEDDFGKLNLFKLAVPQFLDLFLINFLSVFNYYS
mgnify:FL=1